MNRVYYTGIGSRDTPNNVLDMFEHLGEWFAHKGFVLRSGHADGADSAFERGCVKANGPMEIYLPWAGFNGSSSEYILKKDDEAMEIAKQFHPRLNGLSEGAKKLQARNSYQILGYSLDTPSHFVVCWTMNGDGGGGTGQALRIAKHYNIPIFDFGRFGLDSENEAKREFNHFLKDCLHL